MAAPGIAPPPVEQQRQINAAGRNATGYRSRKNESYAR
jgi:hypothetical protein